MITEIRHGRADIPLPVRVSYGMFVCIHIFPAFMQAIVYFNCQTQAAALLPRYGNCSDSYLSRVMQINKWRLYRMVQLSYIEIKNRRGEIYRGYRAEKMRTHLSSGPELFHDMSIGPVKIARMFS